MMLELCGLPYERRDVDLTKGEQFSPWLIHLNAAAAIPVIVDHDSADDEPLVLSQSGAICLYLAEKAGRFLPQSGRRRIETLEWFQHAITDLGFVTSALYLAHSRGDGDTATASLFRQRLIKHMTLVDRRLAGRAFLVDQLTIADVALYPVLLSQMTAAVLDQLDDVHHLRAWMAAMGALPAIARGM